MVNYWMLIGRAVTNTKVLAAFRELKARPYLVDVDRRAFRFTPDDYEAARQAIKKGLSDAGIPIFPMSLIGLGELLYASCYDSDREGLRALSGVMKRHGVPEMPTSDFCTALGAAIVDGELVEMICSGHSKEAMFHLEHGEDVLIKVLCDEQFRIQAEKMRIDCWWPECLSKSRDLRAFVMPAPIQAIPGTIVRFKPDDYAKGAK